MTHDQILQHLKTAVKQWNISTSEVEIEIVAGYTLVQHTQDKNHIQHIAQQAWLWYEEDTSEVEDIATLEKYIVPMMTDAGIKPGHLSMLKDLCEDLLCIPQPKTKAKIFEILVQVVTSQGYAMLDSDARFIASFAIFDGTMETSDGRKALQHYVNSAPGCWTGAIRLSGGVLWTVRKRIHYYEAWIPIAVSNADLQHKLEQHAINIVPSADLEHILELCADMLRTLPKYKQK